MVDNGEEEEGYRWELWTLATAKAVEKVAGLWWMMENKTSAPAEVHQTTAVLAAAAVLAAVVVETVVDGKASFFRESARLMSLVAQWIWLVHEKLLRNAVCPMAGSLVGDLRLLKLGSW